MPARRRRSGDGEDFIASCATKAAMVSGEGQGRGCFLHQFSNNPKSAL